MNETEIKDSLEAYSFYDILIILYDNRSDIKMIDRIGDYVFENKYDYCLVHLYTILYLISGYKKNINHEN